VASFDPSPPMFFINPRDNQLYQVVNETTILYVNVVNITAATSSLSSSAPTASPKADFVVQADANDPYANSPRPKALPPLKLELSKKRGGVPGLWRWQATMLIFEAGNTLGRGKTNQGAYYSCPDEKGVYGLYLFLEPCVFLVERFKYESQPEL
jgi:hypothetical protein